MKPRAAALMALALLIGCGSGGGPAAGPGSVSGDGDANATDAGPAPPAWARGVCSGDGWCWAYPRPLGVKLNRLWGTGPRDLWAVGELGLILHWDGERWTRAASGTGDTLVAIAGRGPGDAWAIGRQRTLLRLEGQTWHRVGVAPDGGPAPGAPQIDEQAELADLTVFPDGQAWIVGGFVKRSLTQEDIAWSCVVGRFDGARWQFDQDDACGPLDRVWGSGPDDVWAAGGDVVHWNGRYLVKNPGTKPAPGEKSAPRPPPLVGRHGWAAGWRLQRDGGGTGGALLHPKHQPDAGSAPRVRDFWAFGAADVWAIGGEGALQHFDGKRWTRADPAASVSAFAARSPSDLWLAGHDRDLLHRDGAGWQAVAAPTAERPVALAAPTGPGRRDVWMITATKAFRFDGKRWGELRRPASGLGLSSLLVLGTEDAWMGSGESLLHWDGKAFQTHATDFNVTSLWSDGRGLGAASPVHRWDGAKMVAPPELETEAGKKMARAAGAVAPDGSLWLAGHGGIARLHYGRLEMMPPLAKPAGLMAIWVDPSGDAWAVGDAIVRVHDGKLTVEDSAGLTQMKAVGGAGDLVWVRGAEGVIVKTRR